MKKFFILASAAIVALASCAKTEVVYKDAPEEIAFKQITGVMTKAGSELSTSMGVYAYLNGSQYFPKTEFAKQSGETTWTAASPKYWPVSGTVDFVMYAPYTDVTASSTTADQLTFTKAKADQIDLLYAKVSSPKTNSAVPVEFKHALSYIEINVAGDASVKLYEVALLNATQAGSGVVTFEETKEVVWTPSATDAVETSYVLFENSVGKALSSTPETVHRLVVPATLAEEQIKITYGLEGSDSKLIYATATKTSSTPNKLGETWEYGKKYIYTLNVGATEIQFAPTEAEWTDGSSVSL